VQEVEAAREAFLAAAWREFWAADPERLWWDRAVGLFYDLAAGHSPPALPVVSPAGEPVHLDAVFDCASWSAAEVRPQERSALVVGPPLVVAVAMAGVAVANRRAREHAEAMARPQWRSHGRVRVLVTSAATWLGRGEDWRRYEHSTVGGIEVAGQALVVRFGGVPVRLVGPAVWCHAVLVTYARHGSSGWVEAEHLEPVRQAVLQRARLAGVLA
jgi:hypothetical protein